MIHTQLPGLFRATIDGPAVPCRGRSGNFLPRGIHVASEGRNIFLAVEGRRSWGNDGPSPIEIRLSIQDAETLRDALNSIIPPPLAESEVEGTCALCHKWVLGPVLNEHDSMCPECCKASNAEFLREARLQWEEEGSIEFDDDAAVSRSEEGAYVQGWLWVDA